MRFLVSILIGGVTVLLIAIAWIQSGGLVRERIRATRTQEEAARLVLMKIQSRSWYQAVSLLANASDVHKSAFAHDLGGSNGSLLTYASLEKFDVWPLLAIDRQATVRTKLHYSTAV